MTTDDAGTQGDAQPRAQDTEGYERIEPRSKLSMSVVLQLVARVANGSLSKGERLPSESELSKRWGIGVSSVREALAVLDGLGVTAVRQGSGRVVRGLTFAALADSRIGPKLVDGSMLRDLYEVRIAIEVNIARIATARAVPEDLAGMEEMVIAMQEAVDAGGQGIAEDGAFHRALAESSHNRVFVWIDDAVQLLTTESRRAGLRHSGRPAQAAREHGEILDAIRAGDADAAEEAVRRHLAPTRQDAEERIAAESAGSASPDGTSSASGPDMPAGA